MKAILLILTIYSLQLVNAQSFYGSISGGYQYVVNEEQPSTYITNSFHQITSPWFWQSESFEFQHVFSSNLSFGYYFNKHIGVEIAGTYLRPNKLTTYDGYTNKEFYGNFWRLNPKLVLEIPLDNISIFSKIGCTIGTGKIVFQQEFSDNGNWNVTFDDQTMIYEYTAPVSFGFNASFGLLKSISRNIQMFTELELIHHSFNPNKGSMVEYTLGDVNSLEQHDYKPYNSEIHFGMETELSYWGSNNVNQPQKLHNRNYSLSGLSLIIGVKFTIWHKEKEVIEEGN